MHKKKRAAAVLREPVRRVRGGDADEKKPLKISKDDFGLTGFSSNGVDSSIRFLSDDPNQLGSLLNEFRQDLGVNPPPHPSRFKPSLAGDPRLIDGPHDYAYSKINSQRHFGPSFPPGPNPPSSGLHTPAYGYPYSQQHPLQQPHGGAYYGGFSQVPPLQQVYPNAGRKEHLSMQDNKSWSSGSGQSHSFLSMGRAPISGYYPYPMPMGYLPQPQQPAYQPKKSAGPEQAWAKSQSGDHTTSSGTGSDHKKIVAQNQIRSLIEQRSSPVVHVKGLESDEISPETIASLFGNFGNISKLLYLKKKHTALIEYLDVDSASVAREMLNNLTFFGAQLKVSYSTYASVDENLASSNNPEKYRDVYSPSPKTFRFKETKKISINPPSKVLHLSNIAREVYSERGISEIFAPHAGVKKVKLINGPEEEKCMALIELDTLENALICIATLHNQVFFSR